MTFDFMWMVTAASIIGTVANIKKYRWRICVLKPNHMVQI